MMPEGEKIGVPVVIFRDNMPSPGYDRVHFSPNIGGGVGLGGSDLPVPPPTPRFRHHIISNAMNYTHSCVLVIEQTFGSAKLLPCGSAKMTELFSAERRTFFVIHSITMASFHNFVLLNDPHVRDVIIGL